VLISAMDSTNINSHMATPILSIAATIPSPVDVPSFVVAPSFGGY